MRLPRTWPLGRRHRTEAELRSILDGFKELYERQRNPIYAWRAWFHARGHGFAVPDWVLGYFDQVALNLLEAAEPLKPTTTPAPPVATRVSNALGFVPGGAPGVLERQYHPDSNAALRENVGAFDPFDEREQRDRDISDCVLYHRARALSLTDAKRKTATLFGVSVRTVERALRQFPHK